MNIYTQTDYRSVLRSAVAERKGFDPDFGFHKLADAARVQKPYLSKVIGGNANLNSDQLYAICRSLKFGEEQHEYMQLLLELERSGLEERRKELRTKIDRIADSKRDSSAHLAAKAVQPDQTNSALLADYYLDPMVQIVHVALSVERYSLNPVLLCKEFHLDGPQIHSIISSLERMGLVVRENNRLIPRETSLHLPKSSPIFRAWRNQLKLLSTQKLNQLTEKDGYSFSVVFSASENTRKEIHSKFLEFLKSIESLVGEAKSKNVYQMSFDLFPWC